MCVYFVPEGQITLLLAVAVGQVGNERNVFLLLSDKLDDGHCGPCNEFSEW
jgi:hypothetical protein